MPDAEERAEAAAKRAEKAAVEAEKAAERAKCTTGDAKVDKSFSHRDAARGTGGSGGQADE